MKLMRHNDKLEVSLIADQSKVHLGGIHVALVENSYYDLENNNCQSYIKTAPSMYEWEKLGISKSLSLKLQYRYGLQQGELIIYASVTNHGKNAVRLDLIYPLLLSPEAGSSIIFDSDIKSLKAFVMTDYAGKYGTGVVDLSADAWQDNCSQFSLEKDVASHGLLVLVSPENKTAFAAGFLNFDHQAGILKSRYRNIDGKVTEITQIAAELEYFKSIGPGETLNLAPLWLAVKTDPLKLLERYADLVRDTMQINLPGNVQSGWVSWYGYRLEIDEQTIRENTKIQQQTMKDLGANFCHIDLGWNSGNRPGDFLEANKSFPNGIASLFKSLTDDGFECSLWSTPLVVSQSSEIYTKHPDWILQDVNGKQLVFGEWFWEPVEPYYCLDPTLPIVQRYIFMLYRTLKKWGTNSFKLDFAPVFDLSTNTDISCSSLLSNISFRGESLSRIEACRKMYSIIRKAVGDSYITVWNAPWQGVIGIADSVSLAEDVGNLTDNDSIDERPERRRWDFITQRSRQILARYFMNGKVWWSDPDCFVAENDAPDNVARIRMQVIMLAGGQIKCSNRLPGWNSQRMNMFLKSLPAYNVAARPIDLFENEAPSILDLHIQTSWEDWHIVGLFNWEDKVQTKTVDFSQLKDPINTIQYVWEFWDKKYHGSYKDEFKLKMPPHTCSMLCIRPKRSNPHLLATDMHFTNGAMEVLEHQWCSDESNLRLTLKRAPGMQGTIWIAIPPDMINLSRSVAAKGAEVNLSRLDDTYFQCNLIFKSSIAEVTVSFVNHTCNSCISGDFA